MTINILRATFRKIAVSRINTVVAARYWTQSNCDAYLISPSTSCGTLYDGTLLTDKSINIKYIPRTLNIDFGIPTNGNLIRNIIEPAVKIPPLQEPTKTHLPIQYDSPVPEKSIDLPSDGKIIDKRAENMLRIRRKKMKRHKRKKLYKKMKYVWAKVRLKKKQKKEKLFQAELIAKVKEAQAFDPKEYVKEKLDFLNKERIPRTYRGEILPPEMIKQFIEEKRAKKAAKYNKPRLTL